MIDAQRKAIRDQAKKNAYERFDTYEGTARSGYIEGYAKGYEAALSHPTPQRDEQKVSNIITRYVCPPIPHRYFDWCAYRDGAEESSIYGWGTSEEGAILDLLAEEEDAKS